MKPKYFTGITLALPAAEFVALKGPSGSGKSTQLDIIGLLARSTSGRLEIAGQSAQLLVDAGLTKLRGATTVQAEANARELLTRVGWPVARRG